MRETSTEALRDKSPLHRLICLIQNVCLSEGSVGYIAPRGLTVLNLRLNKHTEFSQGVLSMALELHRELCQLSEGREALRDLGFQPIFEQVERPSCAVSND